MGSLFQDARACTILYSHPCSRCTWGVSFKMTELAQYFLLFLAAAAHCGVIPDDPCYTEDTNCYEKGVNGVGTVPYLPEIWACELACKDTSGCNWFTWYQQDGFHMCYLLDSCNHPSNDKAGVSGKVNECSPDTTPTRSPTWTSPKSHNYL